MKKIVKNFFYQTIFQLTKIIIPIITVPLVSKALGPEGIGIYNYSNSIAQYFVLLSGLGISLYGNREIALKWNRKENVSATFWEIFSLKAVMTFISLVIYGIIITFLNQTTFFLVQSLLILSVFFDVSWFFMGIEDFKKTSLATLFVQIVTFLGIVLFVKKPNDALIYTMIQASGVLVSQLLVWPFLRRYITFAPIKIKQILLHLRGSIEFFIPQVAIMLYTNLNKTILGIFLGTVAVGYYSNSLQLNTVFITVITTLDVVLLPHMSGLFAQNNEKAITNLMEKTVHLQLYFSIPIMFGILTVFDKLVPWFFGQEFLFINNVTPIFSILVVVIPLGMAISRQYLMPIGKIREYNKSVFSGAIINILLNIILLPTVGFFGVVFANIISEIFVTFVRTKSFLKNTTFHFNKKKILLYLFSAVIMCLITRYSTKNLAANLTTNMIQLIIAAPIYLGLTTILKVNPLIDFMKKK